MSFDQIGGSPEQDPGRVIRHPEGGQPAETIAGSHSGLIRAPGAGSSRVPPGMQDRLVLALQRHAGNAAVAGLLAGHRSATEAPPVEGPDENPGGVAVAGTTGTLPLAASQTGEGPGADEEGMASAGEAVSVDSGPSGLDGGGRVPPLGTTIGDALFAHELGHHLQRVAWSMGGETAAVTADRPSSAERPGEVRPRAEPGTEPA